MSFIGSMFSNSQGSGFQGQSGGPNSDVTGNANFLANKNLGQQMALVNALQGQGNQGMASQSALSNMLAQRAAGGGPNPAAAALAQETGQNAAQTGALMASQRGAGANPGLIARQAAQQGANLQQQAVGQAATMQAQQQIAAQNQLQNLAQQQLAEQMGAQSNLAGNIGGLLGQNVSMQSNQNQVNAEIARGNQAGQQNMVGQLAQGLGAAAMLAKGGQVERHYFAGGGNSLDNSSSSAPDNSTLSNSSGSDDGSGFASKVGAFLHKFNSNLQNAPQPSQQNNNSQNSGPNAMGQGGNAIGQAIGKGLRSLFSTPAAPSPTPSALPSGGMGANLMPGELKALSPSALGVTPMMALAAAHGGQMPEQDMRNSGGHVPGKAKVEGNSYSNDTVPAMLSPGEIVLPRSVTHAEDPEKAAVEFVRKTLSKKHKS